MHICMLAICQISPIMTLVVTWDINFYCVLKFTDVTISSSAATALTCLNSFNKNKE